MTTMANQDQTIDLHVFVKSMLCFEIDTVGMTIPIDVITNPQKKWGSFEKFPSKSISTTFYC
jgi:hypothetical protein